MSSSPTNAQAHADDALAQHHRYQKRSPPETVEEQEQEQGGSGKKRARGRPRVEPKDDTAADRRRTQIRLAQRAYRNRKETAIQTLEKKVNSLQDSNEEMSKAFMNLYDTAVSHGLLASAPDFGRQLQATTQKFVALAKKTSEDAELGHDNGPESVDGGGSLGSNDARRLSDSPESTGWQADRQAPPPQQSSSDTSGSSGTKSASPNQTTASLASTWGEPSRIQGVAAPRNEHIVPLSAAPFGYRIAKGRGSTDGVASRPAVVTSDASLPFGMSLDANQDLGSNLGPSIPFAALTAAAATSTPFSSLLSPSPLTVPLVPPSYSYLERTFGRRLQRSALEQGLVLLHLPSPPPEIYAAVFGFCLLFQSRDAIAKRMTDTISRHARQTLHNWRQPFFHLGGAGSFFGLMNHATDYSDVSSSGEDEAFSTPSPPDNNAEFPVGNQGTDGPHKPMRGVNFATGPFLPEIEEVRDTRVDQRMRMLVPGFEGQFYDPDEVEYFLRKRGVFIPPAADFVTAEVDPNDFALGPEDGEEGVVPGWADGTPGTVDILDPVFEEPSNHSTEAAARQSTELSASAQFEEALTRFDPDADPFADFNSADLPSLDDMDFNFASLPDMAMEFTGKSPPVPSRRKVTINVKSLVDEMTFRAVCLGRCPGIRPKDVVCAFWAACCEE